VVPIEEPRNKLAEAVERNGLQGRVFPLFTGERWVDPDEGGAPWVTREIARSGHASR
jgi:hypothetical protein